VYQAYQIALQRAPERFDFFPALVGELFCPTRSSSVRRSFATAEPRMRSLGERPRRRARGLGLGRGPRGTGAGRAAAAGWNVPFGGIKGSGLGVEFGQEGLQACTTIRIINAAA